VRKFGHGRFAGRFYFRGRRPWATGPARETRSASQSAAFSSCSAVDLGAQTRPHTESGRFAGRSNKCTPRAITTAPELVRRGCSLPDRFLTPRRRSNRPEQSGLPLEVAAAVPRYFTSQSPNIFVRHLTPCGTKVTARGRLRPSRTDPPARKPNSRRSRGRRSRRRTRRCPRPPRRAVRAHSQAHRARRRPG
jgi:hypothetical protein